MSARVFRLLSIVLFAVPSIAQASPAGEGPGTSKPQHLLRMAYEPGKVEFYEQSTVAVTSAKLKDRAVETTMTSSVLLRSEIEKVEAGKATVQRRFERITAHMQGLMKLDYDSDDPESRPGPFEPLADMVGESVTLQMNDRGGITEVKLSKEFPERVFEMLGGDIQQMFAQSVPELPEQPIAVGGKWSTELSVGTGQMGAMKVRIDNELATVEGRLARLEQVMTIDPASAKLPAGVVLTSERAQGFTVIDLATGMPQDSQMELVMKVQGGGPQPIDVTMRMTMRMKRTEAPAKKAAAEPVKSGDAK